MPTLVDLTGCRFGRLVVVDRNLNRKGTFWNCLCDCGAKVTVRANGLSMGKTLSCGCYNRDLISQKQLADFTGQTFGDLTVIERGPNGSRGQVRWVCRCKCGNATLTWASNLRDGSAISCGCSKKKTGAQSKSWKGGRKEGAHGYVSVYAPEHPAARNGTYVFEHRLVMEKRLGRLLKPTETVHHVNGIRNDNRDENLELWSKVHPNGQRVEDLIAFCAEFLREYAPEKLKSDPD